MKKPIERNDYTKFKLLLTFIPIAYLSLLFHELGHWIIGEILGNNMTISLNNVSPKNGQYIGQNHYFYVLCGGPLFTIFLSLFSLCVIERHKVIYAYPIVFFNFIVRLFPLVVMFNMQDEAKISELLRAGKYTIAIISLTLLLLITWRANFTLKLSYKDNLLCFIASFVCIFLVLITDSFI